MNCIQIVFSPTGGTQKVTDILTERFTEVRKVDLCRRETDFSTVEIGKDELAVIAVPSYGGRVPAVAAERIGMLRGGGARAVLVCVYGNRAYEDTLAELEDLAKSSGFEVTAAVAAVAEHSILRQYAAGRPDGSDRDTLLEYAEKIGEKLDSGSTAAPSIPGNRPYKKAGPSSLTPKTGKTCTKCGLCAGDCPVGAISAEDPAAVDASRCIACMRCVTRCPQKAKHVNAAVLGAVSLALKKACSEPKRCELYL